MLTFPTRCIYINAYLLVMAEWKVLAPDVSAGSLEQQQLHIIVNVIHPPKSRLPTQHLHGCCQGDHPFSDCFCMGLGMRWCWQHVQHVWWHWIYEYAMCYTTHVQ